MADGAVTGAHAYTAAGTYTAYVVVDDGWTSRVVEVPVTVTEGQPTLAVDVTVSTRCLAGKAYVAVRAENGEDVPLAIRLVTPFGTKESSRRRRAGRQRLPVVRDAGHGGRGRHRHRRGDARHRRRGGDGVDPGRLRRRDLRLNP